MSTTTQQQDYVEWLGRVRKTHRQIQAELVRDLIDGNCAKRKFLVILDWVEKHTRMHVQ